MNNTTSRIWHSNKRGNEAIIEALTYFGKHYKRKPVSVEVRAEVGVELEEIAGIPIEQAKSGVLIGDVIVSWEAP